MTPNTVTNDQLLCKTCGTGVPVLKSVGFRFLEDLESSLDVAYIRVRETDHEDIEAIEDLAAAHDQFRMVQTASDLAAVLATWEPDQPEDRRQIGIILALEGAQPVSEPAALAEWHARGLRSVGLAWSGTRYAGGNYAGGDLTALGRDLLIEMARLGML